MFTRNSHNLRCSRYLLTVAVLLLTGVMLFAGACGGSEETTTTVAAETTTTAGTSTTAAADTTTTAAETSTTEESAGGTSGNVAVKGMADNPMVITAAELEKMTVAEITVDHPKLGMTDYRGVRLSDLFTTLGVQSGATLVDMTASDGYMAEVALADIEASADALLAIGDDGTLSVVIPGMESKSWVKDIVSFEFK